jgi:hypothetical protein
LSYHQSKNEEKQPSLDASRKRSSLFNIDTSNIPLFRNSQSATPTVSPATNIQLKNQTKIKKLALALNKEKTHIDEPKQEDIVIIRDLPPLKGSF